MTRIEHLLHIRERGLSKDVNLKNINLKDIDTIAFLGLRLDDDVDLSTLPPRTIPYGDRIIRSFTVG